MDTTEVVKLLLAKGADPDIRSSGNRTPLSWAAALGRTAIVEQLLAKGADPRLRDTGGRTLAAWAVDQGHRAIVDLLQQHDPANKSVKT